MTGVKCPLPCFYPSIPVACVHSIVLVRALGLAMAAFPRKGVARRYLLLLGRIPLVERSMPIPVICSCGKQLKAKVSHAGRKARCPRCRNPVAIPRLHSPHDDDRLAAPGSHGGWLRPLALALVFTVPTV